MPKTHEVVIIPGLGDDTRKISLVTRFWARHGLNPIVHSVGWQDSEQRFQPKLERLVQLIDTLLSQDSTVSLVGTSAGGSAVINTFLERRDKIHRVVNVCGRLRVGPINGYRSFKAKTAKSPSFAQSVEFCEDHLDELTDLDKSKIMTVHALLGDELVPPETTIIDGAKNISIPTPEHMLTITMALTVFSRPIISFLTEE